MTYLENTQKSCHGLRKAVMIHYMELVIHCFKIIFCRFKQGSKFQGYLSTTLKMTSEGGKQQNTAYGVFVQACWAQHKRQYPDELIHKEIEEFNKQCSVWWYNLSEQERERFQEMADRYWCTGVLKIRFRLSLFNC